MTVENLTNYFQNYYPDAGIIIRYDNEEYIIDELYEDYKDHKCIIIIQKKVGESHEVV